MREMTEVLDHPQQWECGTCGHKWERRLGDGDHEISGKVDGIALGLKACLLTKA